MRDTFAQVLVTKLLSLEIIKKYKVFPIFFLEVQFNPLHMADLVVR